MGIFTIKGREGVTGIKMDKRGYDEFAFDFKLNNKAIYYNWQFKSNFVRWDLYFQSYFEV